MWAKRETPSDTLVWFVRTPLKFERINQHRGVEEFTQRGGCRMRQCLELLDDQLVVEFPVVHDASCL